MIERREEIQKELCNNMVAILTKRQGDGFETIDHYECKEYGIVPCHLNCGDARWVDMCKCQHFI